MVIKKKLLHAETNLTLFCYLFDCIEQYGGGFVFPLFIFLQSFLQHCCCPMPRLLHCYRLRVTGFKVGPPPSYWGESSFCQIEENLGEEAGKEEGASSRSQAEVKHPAKQHKSYFFSEEFEETSHPPQHHGP